MKSKTEENSNNFKIKKNKKDEMGLRAGGEAVCELASFKAKRWVEEKT